MGKDPEPVKEWKNNSINKELSIEDSQLYIREEYID
jgi:uncharacterized protein